MSRLGLTEKPQTMKKARQSNNKFARRVSPETREMTKQRRKAIWGMEIESVSRALAPRVEGKVVNLSV